jgi:rod shape-determining protein MreD
MVNRRFKVIIFIFLVLGQIVIHRYAHHLKLNLDLFYLILVYISVTGGFYKSLIAGMVVGLITDYLSMNVLGVFGFSRAFAAYLLNEISRGIDLRNNTFVFLLIAGSLAMSNGIANIFFYLILGSGFNLSLILYQPLLTALVGLIITSTDKAKKYLDVY